MLTVLYGTRASDLTVPQYVFIEMLKTVVTRNNVAPGAAIAEARDLTDRAIKAMEKL